MKDLKNLSVDTSLKFSEDAFSDSRYIKGRIKVMHNGLNPNGSNFEDENIDNAKNTLSNIFVLANVVEVEEGKFDFGAHDYKIEENKIEKDTFKIIYEELPIGLIPETNNYEYKLDEESGRYYVWVDCIIIRDYSNYAEDIIKRYIEEDKDIKISMEIEVNDYEYNQDEDFFNIVSYKYTAITMLGENFGTGMIAAKASFNSDEINEKRLDFEKKVVELGKLFSLSNEEIKSNKKEVVLNMALTVRQKLQLLNNSIDDDRTFEEDDVISSIDYWVSDMNDEFAYIERWSWTVEDGGSDDNVKATYTISEDEQTAVINKESFEVLTREYLTKAEKDLVEESRNREFQEATGELTCKILELEKAIEEKQSEFDLKVEELNTLQETLDTKDSEFQVSLDLVGKELEELKQYKAKVQDEIHKANIDEVIDGFSEKLNENEEFELIKQDPYNNSVEDLTNKLYVIVGKLNHKADFDKKSTEKNKSFAKLDLEDDKIDDKNSKYGEYAKYIDKEK